MVGEGVLLECLQSNEVSEVLSVSRKPTGYTHEKLKEYIVSDFLSLQPNDDKLKGYDACFFCAGVSSVGMKEADYFRFTYDTALTFAEAINPNPQMTFVYVSGTGTDSTEKGKTMWARIKGKTENDLMKLPFKNVFAFRPAVMQPTAGQRYAFASYPYMKYLKWLFPIVKIVFPNFTSTMQQVGQAMINTVTKGYSKNILETKDIKEAATL